jgi:hypothetical protein
MSLGLGVALALSSHPALALEVTSTLSLAATAFDLGGVSKGADTILYFALTDLDWLQTKDNNIRPNSLFMHFAQHCELV